MKNIPFLFLSFILSFFCLQLNSYANEPHQATLVTTAKITRGTLNDEQGFIGSIHFQQSSLLASKTDGLVLKVNFDTTDQVKKGDVLVELDHEILDSRIRAIQASLKELNLLEEKSSKDLRRYQKLLQNKNVSQQKYDEIYYDKTRLDQKIISSQAELEALILEQNQSIITAPFNGVITERHVELGEWVEVGGKIATLVNPEKITALFDIPAYYAMNIQPETKIIIQVGDQPFQGIVEGIIIQGDTRSRTFPLKIRVLDSNTRLFEGMEAKINLPRSTQKNMLLVPRDAIMKRFGSNVIFIAEKGKAIMYPIKVELFNGSLAAISEITDESSDSSQFEDVQNTNKPELKAGMQVIIKGNERIFPDQTIRLN